jgi:mutator protein MutT
MAKAGVDYIGVGVGALIVDGQGRFLVGLRGPLSKNERGTWEIPGGAVQFGETFPAALQREIKEEIGVEIEVGEMLHVCNHLVPAEKQHWVSPTFVARITAGEPQILEPGKCDGLRWVTVAEARQLPLSIVTTEDIKALEQKIANGQIVWPPRWSE